MENMHMSEAELERVSGETGRALARQRKVSIVIEDAGEDRFWTGALNGWFFRIRRGEAVEVPEAVAELIAENERVRRLARDEVALFRRGGQGGLT